jgi:hypothetical protein
MPFVMPPIKKEFVLVGLVVIGFIFKDKIIARLSKDGGEKNDDTPIEPKANLPHQF